MASDASGHPARQQRKFPLDGDQVAAAVIVVLAVAMAGLWYVERVCLREGALDIDRAARKSIDYKIDVNTASWQELTLLPNIGKTMAQRIVNSRQVDGPFTCHADLCRVEGVGPSLLGRIKPFLYPLPEANTTVRQ